MKPAPPATVATPGLHHVSVLAGDPRANMAFWTGTMGLRLVKRTVNFDAPSMHHLYYGDRFGTPGTILTFFPVPGAARSHGGTGRTSAVAFAVHAAALDAWRARLSAAGRETVDSERFGRPILAFDDPDGLRIELVGHDAPAAARLQGFDSVTLHLASAGASQAVLERVGYRVVAEQREGRARRLRLETGSGEVGEAIELLEEGEETRGRDGRGTVHHVALRLPGDEEQARVAQRMRTLGRNVSEVRDRVYFRSIYLREPGGVLLEFATDGPGFAIDEDAAELGGSLRLPRWLEPRRGEIERVLPPLELDPALAS